MLDKMIYEELISGNLYKKKIDNAQIILLKNNGNKSELKNEIKQIIKYYNK